MLLYFLISVCKVKEIMRYIFSGFHGHCLIVKRFESLCRDVGDDLFQCFNPLVGVVFREYGCDVKTWYGL